MEINEVYSAIKSATRKRLFFGAKKLFEQLSVHTEEGLLQLEATGGYKFPVDVKNALLALGGCSVEDLYMHQSDKIYRFDEANGDVAGYVTFASDINGDHFAFNPESDDPNLIFFCCHDPYGYAVVAKNFSDYLRSFCSSGLDTLSLTEDLKLKEE